MDKLITDGYIRGCASAILIAGLVILVGLQSGFLYLVLGTINTWFSEPPTVLQVVLDLLKFPFENEFSSFTAAAAGILPVAIANVCFAVKNADPPPPAPQPQKVLTSDFNFVGRAAVTLLLLGTALGVLVKIIQQVYANDIGLMTSNDNETTAIRSTLTMILGFDILYFMQLMGMKK